MSWDYSSKSVCDHLQLMERYVIDVFDFKTLHYAANPTFNMRAPINGVDQTRVFLRGVQINPADPNLGYVVVPDPVRIETNYVFSKIMFKNPVRMVQPLVEVCYLTRPAFCLKCLGTKSVNDWNIDPSGQLTRVSKIAKLTQQCLKYLLTSRNPFNPNLVCRIKSYIGTKSMVTTDDITNEVVNSLSSYQTIQNAQQTVQTLDPSEILKDISSVTAQQSPTNPLLVQLGVQVTTYGTSQTIPLNIALQANS